MGKSRYLHPSLLRSAIFESPRGHDRQSCCVQCEHQVTHHVGIKHHNAMGLGYLLFLLARPLLSLPPALSLNGDPLPGWFRHGAVRHRIGTHRVTLRIEEPHFLLSHFTPGHPWWRWWVRVILWEPGYDTCAGTVQTSGHWP